MYAGRLVITLSESGQVRTVAAYGRTPPGALEAVRRKLGLDKDPLPAAKGRYGQAYGRKNEESTRTEEERRCGRYRGAGDSISVAAKSRTRKAANRRAQGQHHVQPVCRPYRLAGRNRRQGSTVSDCGAVAASRARPRRSLENNSRDIFLLAVRIVATIISPWPRSMGRAGHGAAWGGPREGCAMAITVGDLIEYKTGFGAKWRPGHVESIERHAYQIRDLQGKKVTIKTGGQGRRGRVRELTGAACVAAVEAARLPALPSATGVTLRVLQGGLGVAVPRPRSRFRSPVYLAAVRAQPCCSCNAPGPSDPHHHGTRGVGQKADDYATVPLCRRCHDTITSTNALPGRTREESTLLILVTQVALLSQWAADQAELIADHVAVPVLRGFAS